MAWFDLAVDRDGISRAAADAVGGGRREAFGVLQLAAALLLCAKNVSVPRRPLAEHPETLVGWAYCGALPRPCYS
ncbi:MAG: hypothetical protein GX456_07285 [Verrucomicrobia bacterium]|nr:hypothetical protein [Verrucomicrobiota bacterium]